MAEQHEGKTCTGSVLQGSFNIKGTKYEVSLTDEHVSWKKSVGKVDEITIPIINIVSVKNAASKSSKAGAVDSWILCYTQRKKNNHLKKVSIVFTGDDNDCQEWTKRIHQALDTCTQRPKKILAIINPISGFKKGEKEYHSKVGPIFAEANITTDVIVTERSNHSPEILANYDLSTIDGIVTVGGDGIYSEVVSGLMHRKLKEANIGLNDPKLDLPCIDVPIGIIPCGTGNVMAQGMYGCRDLETAALSIVIGKRNDVGVETVHCCEEFVMFSVQSLGTGIWASVVNKSEQNRNLRLLRVPFLFTKELFIKSPRPIRYQIQYKSPVSNQLQQMLGTHVPEEGACVQDTDSTVVGKESKESFDGRTEWHTVEEDFTGIMIFESHFFADAHTIPYRPTSTIFGLRPCTRMQMVKFIVCILKRDFTVPLDFVEKYKTTEYTIKVVNPSERDSNEGLVDRLVAIDGEPIELKQPEYTFRYFPKRHSLFANVPEDFWMAKDGHTVESN